jgi:hypothetical protein
MRNRLPASASATFSVSASDASFPGDCASNRNVNLPLSGGELR